jgi:antitoxin (DNA-binding transcriptional repressor) of toxin-antitoxin stability system
MIEMNTTEFARNLRSVFDRIEHRGEVIVLVRNKHRIARIIPGAPHLTAREAMGDLYNTLPPDAGRDWVKDSRLKRTLKEEIENPWDA